MMRLCLVLLSCCVFTTFADNRIDEIINAFHKMEQNSPRELVNTYFQIPSYLKAKCTSGALPKLTELLKSIHKRCKEEVNCNAEFEGYLEVALANLKILSNHVVECPALTQNKYCSKRIKEEKMHSWLVKSKRFLLEVKQKMCNKSH